MSKQRSGELPVAIERVRSQFEEWRAHKSRRDRSPERLWSAAAEAAQRHGVHAVSRAVRIEHSALRRRVQATSSGHDVTVKTGKRVVRRSASGTEHTVLELDHAYARP